MVPQAPRKAHQSRSGSDSGARAGRRDNRPGWEEYGRAAIAAYVRGWLGDAEVREFKDLDIQDDKAYIMSLLAVLTGSDPAAGYQIRELEGTFSEHGYSIPQMQIRRKEKKR